MCKFSTSSARFGSKQNEDIMYLTFSNKNNIFTHLIGLPFSALMMPLRTKKSMVTGQLVVFMSSEVTLLMTYDEYK